MSLTKQRFRYLPFALLFFLVSAKAAFAQIVDPQNVLIKNVQLIDRDDDTEDVVVNILIRDNKVEIVTRDEIPVDNTSMAIDARNGFLLGALKIGEMPSFIILDQDPRKNFDVLLDTGTHAVFAVHQGELRKNNLFEVVEDKAVPTEDTRTSGWLAYTPPPMMLPTSYQDGDKWNQWQSKYINGIFIAAVVLDRQRWLSQDDGSLQHFGDLTVFDGGEIRGFRFGAAGTINFDKPWFYSVAAATNAFEKGFDVTRDDDLTFFDYRVDIPLARGVNMSVGKQKEPISMERLMSMVNLPMQERAAVSDAMLPSRNVGVLVSGGALNQRMTWAGGVFNDWFDAGQSFSESSSQVIGRVTYLPFISQDESNLVHLGFGARYTNAREGLQFLTEPEFNQSPLFVDTGDPFPANSAMQYNLEASWRKGPYWLAGEYVRTDVDSPTVGDPTFDGYHITGSWVISGEMRSYNRKNGLMRLVPVARSVYQGGWGAWELGVRYSTVDLTDGLITGGEMDILSLGVNWWLSPIFNVNFNYRHIVLDRFGHDGTSDGINARVMLVLE